MVDQDVLPARSRRRWRRSRPLRPRSTRQRALRVAVEEFQVLDDERHKVPPCRDRIRSGRIANDGLRPAAGDRGAVVEPDLATRATPRASRARSERWSAGCRRSVQRIATMRSVSVGPGPPCLVEERSFGPVATARHFRPLASGSVSETRSVRAYRKSTRRRSRAFARIADSAVAQQAALDTFSSTPGAGNGHRLKQSARSRADRLHRESPLIPPENTSGGAPSRRQSC